MKKIQQQNFISIWTIPDRIRNTEYNLRGMSPPEKLLRYRYSSRKITLFDKKGLHFSEERNS